MVRNGHWTYQQNRSLAGYPRNAAELDPYAGAAVPSSPAGLRVAYAEQLRLAAHCGPINIGSNVT